MGAWPALHARLPCLTCLPNQFLAGQVISGKLPIESANLIAGLLDLMPVYSSHFDIYICLLPLVHYCTLSMTECRVGTPYMRRNFIDGPPKASVDQSGPSFLQKLHIGYVPGPQKNFGDPSTFF